MSNILVASTILIALNTGPQVPALDLSPKGFDQLYLLAQKELDLTQRQADRYVNQIFADNILLYLHYLKGDADAAGNDQQTTTNQKTVNFEEVRQPFSFSLTLLPGEVFSFHPDLLPEFQSKPKKTAPTTFKSTEGYRFVAGLWGNGVCHLASLMNRVAQEAGLKVVAKVNHDFAPVYGVPREFGTAIYYMDGAHSVNQNQNLYIENCYEFPVTLNFAASEEKVIMAVTHMPTPPVLPPAIPLTTAWL